MPAEPLHYRIRGITMSEPAIPGPKKEARKISASEFSPGPSLDAALRAIGRPYLDEFVSQAPVERLQAWWPTFAFFANPEPSRAIKAQPVALGPYVPDSHSLASTPELKIIEESYQRQADEVRNIQHVLAMTEGKKLEVSSIETPVAATLLGAFFRGSKWLKRHEVRLFDLMKLSPVAAYILVHLGKPGQREDFIRQVVPDPRLILDLCTVKQFRNLISCEMLTEAFEQFPHLHVLARFARAELSPAKDWEALVDTATKDALSAAFALGLDPNHEEAKAWHARISSNPEAIYWTLRVWTTQHKAEQFPYWQLYQTLVRRELRWLYHWVRDIDRSETEALVRWHWPSPWAIELIADLKMSSAFVQELYQGSFANSDPDDPWSSTLTLWASAYLEEKEEK
jgi:hypothetical protein